MRKRFKIPRSNEDGAVINLIPYGYKEVESEKEKEKRRREHGDRLKKDFLLCPFLIMGYLKLNGLEVLADLLLYAAIEIVVLDVILFM